MAGKKKLKSAKNVSKAEVKKYMDGLEEARQEMIVQGRTHLEVTLRELNHLTGKEESLLEEIKHIARTVSLLKEHKVTWLERICMMMGINAARKVMGEEIMLCFADTDGDIVNDEEGVPLHQIHTFEDISCLIMTVPKKA